MRLREAITKMAGGNPKGVTPEEIERNKPKMNRISSKKEEKMLEGITMSLSSLAFGVAGEALTYLNVNSLMNNTSFLSNPYLDLTAWSLLGAGGMCLLGLSGALGKGAYDAYKELKTMSQNKK